jgi:hypothetical protein
VPDTSELSTTASLLAGVDDLLMTIAASRTKTNTRTTAAVFAGSI